MISQGSHDTEDWSNDAENPALHPKNLFHNISQIKKKCKKSYQH